MPRRFLRGFRQLLAMAAALLLLTGQACAVEIPPELWERFGLGELEKAVPEQAKTAALGELSFGELLQLSPGELWEALRLQVSQAADAYGQAFLSLIGLLLLFAAVGQVGGRSFSQEIAGCLFSVFAVLLLREPVLHAVGSVSETIRGAAQFLLAFVPVYAAALAAGGSPATASFYHVAVLGGAQIISTAVQTSLVPLCCVFLNLCIAEGFAGDLFPRWSQAVRKTVNWVLVLLTTVFAGLLSLQSALTGAADGASVKTAKLLVGTFVPVIGSAVSDAVQAAQGSLRIIRAAVGSFGIAATALTFLPALAEVVLLRLGLGASSVLAELLSAGTLVPILKGMGQLLSVLTALLLTMALLIVVSTAVMLTAGGAA